MQKYIFGENNELVLRENGANLVLISIGYNKNIQIQLNSILSKAEIDQIKAIPVVDDLEFTIYCNYTVFSHDEKESYGEDRDYNRGIIKEITVVDDINVDSLKLEISTCYINSPLKLEKVITEIDPGLNRQIELLLKELIDNNKINLN